MQLTRLEQCLGVPLFERGRKNLVLTEVGRSAVEQARRTLAEARMVQEIADAHRDGESGRFRFWISMMVLIWLFPLGWPDIAYGTYSPAEVILTFAIASCATLGLTPSFRLGQPVAACRRTYLSVLAAAVQSGFMILSFQAPFASR